MKGLVLAAGLGSRLKPFTDHLPKPLVPIFGRPCIAYLLDWLAEAGIVEVAINTHWLPEPLHDALGDGSAFGLRLHWQHEPVLLDGMGTLKSFAWLFGDETVVCLNGDVVMDLPFQPLLETHRRLEADLTLMTVETIGPPKSPLSWSADGRLRGMRRSGHQHPEATRFGDFAGVHVIEPVIWREHIPAGRPYHLITDLWPDLVCHGRRLTCHLAHGLWADVGTPAQLHQAHVMALLARSGRYLAVVPEVQPDVWIGEGAAIAGELVPPVWVGPGAVVGAGARLGPFGVLAAGQVLSAGRAVAYAVAGGLTSGRRR